MRFQNISEQAEDLTSTISEAVAELLEEPEEMKWEFDIVYRINSIYANKNNLPREVHITFAKCATRDQLLRATRDKVLKIRDKEIKALKNFFVDH